MADTREHDVIRTFVALSGGLATGHDTVALLDDLTSSCSRLLDVSSAGLLLADGQGVLHLLSASSQNTRHLETFQLQSSQGPCLDCYRTGEPVSVADLSTMRQRWPHFVAAAELTGFASVHAVPMRLQETVLGALGLFRAAVGSVPADDLALAQALADVASVAIVQDRSRVDGDKLNAQLQGALTSRVVIEQAKGVLAQQGSLTMDEAWAALRRYCRDNNFRLADTADRIASRDLKARDVLTQVTTRNVETGRSPGSHEE